MLGLALLAALAVVGCTVIFAALTGLIYGVLYSAPAEGLPWRAPLAGLIAGGFLAGWCALERFYPGLYDTPLAFSPVEAKEFPKLTTERKGDTGVRIEEYTRGRGDRGRPVYRDADGRPWARVTDRGMALAVVVDDQGTSRRFDAEMNPDGTYRIEEGRPLRFVDAATGEAMTENDLGTVRATRWSLLLGNVFLALAHLLVWWLCFGLVLNYQWGHALGLAVVLWLVMTFGVWPVLKGQVPKETAAAVAVRA